MYVELPCGRSQLRVNLPSNADVHLIRKADMPCVANPIEQCALAINRPVSSPTLAEITNHHDSACILVCDITRPVPNHLILPTLLDCLIANGIPAYNIELLIATGLHRPNLDAELDEVLGRFALPSGVKVSNHYARDDTSHHKLGTTSRNIPVSLDCRFLAADLKIATGLVEPHFMAGFSGGRKVILPGIASAETIRHFHSARMLENPAARSCNLEHNPLHETQLEVLEMVRNQTNDGIYAINTVITDERELAFMNFGEIEASHMEAVDFAHQYSTVAVDEPFDTILTSAGGFPLDQTYYQTVKGMVTPLEIANDDADLFVVSECAEGLGSDSYRAVQKHLLDISATPFKDELFKKELADIDEWETEMQLRAQDRANVHLYQTNMPATDQQLTGVNMVSDLEQEISESLARHDNARLAVIPEGPYVIPTLI